MFTIDCSIICSRFQSLSHHLWFKPLSLRRLMLCCWLLGDCRSVSSRLFGLRVTQVFHRFSGHSLGVWTLHKDFVSGEGLALSGSRTLKRGGKDVKRPATSDTTTTDHDTVEEAKDTHTRLNPNPDSSVHMDILEDAFKNRFA